MRPTPFFLITALAFVGLLNLQATPEKYVSGVPTLEAFLKSAQYPPNHEVVGMTGFYGQDQPKQWLILTKAKDADFWFEFVLVDKKVQKRRSIRRLPNQAVPTIGIDLKRLKYDSDLAFEIAELKAQAESVGYDSVHYQLRSREQDSEPVWVVNMLDPAGKSIGIHYISAETGVMLRSVWHRVNRDALTKVEKGPDGKPESLLYGGKVTEISISGNAGRQVRSVKRVVRPVVAQ